MNAIAASLAFLGAMGAGVYLIMHDHATLGGWVVILALLATWGFESREEKK